MADASGNKPKDSIDKPVSFEICINGVLVASEKVIKINIEKAINRISRAKVFLSGGDASLHTFKESEDNNFSPGNSVKIELGYAQNNVLAFEGIVEKLGISLKNGFATKPWQSLLVLECVDVAIKLTNSYTSDVYVEKKDSEIFAALLSKVDELDSDITPTNVIHPFFPKYNSSDWEFILDRAKINGLVLLNSNNKIKISKPNGPDTLPKQTITNGEATINFDAQIDSSSQLTSLTFNSCNYYKDTVEDSQAEEPSLIANNILTGKVISGSTSAKDININIPERTKEELKAISDAFLQESRLSRIVGRAKFKGVTNLDIGSVVALAGFGVNFNGKIYLTAISHQIESGFFTTSIEFGLKKSQSLANIIDKSSVIKPIEGVHIGTVKKIDKDPLDQGRIQVLIPALQQSEGSGIWAKLSHFYVSAAAGSFFIPEVGSQVVVSFISNDPRHPIILGSLYTQAKQPYTKLTADNALKAFVSKSKLTLEFDDKEKIITISSPKENSIVISEKEKGIIITDQNKNVIKMSDTGIELTSKKDIKITSSGSVTIAGSKGVILEGKTGDGIKVTGSKVNIAAKTTFVAKGGSKADVVASGKVTIKGASVGIN